MILAFVEAKVLTNTLNISDYGAYNQILTSVSLIVIVLGLNLGHGFIRFASSYSAERKKHTFHTVLLLQAIIYVSATLLILPLAPKISHFLTNRSALYPVLFIGILAVMSGGITNIQNFILVSGNDVKMLKQNLYKAIIDATFIIIFVLILPNIYGALLGYLLGELSCFVLFSAINHVDFRGIKIHADILKELLRFSLPLIVASITYWIINSSNRYFINYYWGLDMVGKFAIANRLPMMIVTIFTLLSTVFLSNTARLYDNGNKERVSYWFSNMIKVFVLLGTAGASLLIVAHKFITLVIATPQYLFTGIAQFYMWLCVGGICFGLFQIITKTYDLEKKTKLISVVWTFILLVNISLNFLLIPSFGLLGSAWATVVSFGLGLIFALIFRPRTIKFAISWIKLFTYMLTSIFLTYVVTTVVSKYNFGIWVDSLFSVIVFVVVMAVGFAIKVVSYPEIKEILISKQKK